MAHTKIRRKPVRPDVCMTQGPTFEKVCALVVWALAQGMLPERVRIQFEDLHGTPPDALPDIDVRRHYPMGSSAFEQTLLAFQPDEIKDFASLTAMLNLNNATGCLKEGALQRWSLVRLIRKSYDLRPGAKGSVGAWRQKVVGSFLPVAETAILFHLVQAELDTPDARLVFAASYPKIAAMGPLVPFTLPGYAYAQWLMWPSGFRAFLCGEFRVWKTRFARAAKARSARVEALRAAQHPMYRCEFTKARILCLEAETDQDASAAFEAYPKADIIVMRDLRPLIPSAAILPRESRPIVREMHAIHVALATLEPGAWYALARPSGMSFLLNGSTSRAPKVPSNLARCEASIMGTILLALEDLRRRHDARTEP